MKLLAYYENGFRQLTNSVREVKSPADLKGLKIRTMENPIHLALWRALGANPTPMPFSEVFTAMQQKTIDGQENPVPTIFLSKFYEVQKYLTMTGHVYGPHILLINKKLWDSFPAEDQKVIQQAAQESAVFQRATNRKMNSDLVSQLKDKGMTVTYLTSDQLKAFQDATKSVYEQWVPKIGKDLVDEFQATVAAVK
jgi:tripartite ATP-independent transporter DctP family solute receptor